MRPFKSLLAAGLIVGLPSLAHAQWYVGADAGANFLQDSSVSAGTNNKTDFDWGYVGLGQVGYNFGGPKVEFEVGYRDNDVDSVGGAGGSGDANSWSFMANGLYEFLPNSSWHPFLGAGIGYANVDGKGSNSSTSWSGDDWQFAYQGIAGVSYDVTKNWAIKAQYRYFATLDYDVTSGSNKGDAEYENHSVLVGFTYNFGKPAPAPAPVVAAAPAPQPAPAPVPKAAPQSQRNYMVFFDFNKADVTAEANQIITQAAAAAKKNQITRVELTGHTDRSGSDKYNQALSQKRADAVKAHLVKSGIPADQIIVTAKGESTPMVQTPDNVKEPQNRRVEIILP